MDLHDFYNGFTKTLGKESVILLNREHPLHEGSYTEKIEVQRTNPLLPGIRYIEFSYIVGLTVSRTV